VRHVCGRREKTHKKTWYSIDGAAPG
jgi:hypothetical protein